MSWFNPECDGAKETYFLYVIPSLAILAAVVVAICCVIFVFKYVRDKVIKIPCSLFVVCTLFFLVIVTYCSVITPFSIYLCLDPFRIFGGPISIALNVSASFRLISLQQIMFYRAFLALRGTRFAFRKCTIFLWCITCAGFYISLAVRHFLSVDGYRSNLNRLDVALKMKDIQHAVYNVFVLWVDFSFIYKLSEVHKAMQKTNQSDTPSCFADGADYNKLLPLITKITVLTMASSITLYAGAVCGFFWHDLVLSGEYSPHMHAFYIFLSVLDAFANFLTIYLSFAPFEVLYQRLCGRCDRCCHALCIRCTGFKKHAAHSRSTNNEFAMSNVSATTTTTNDVTSGSGKSNDAAANMVKGSHCEVPMTARRENEITVFQLERSLVAVPSAGSPEL